MKKFALVIAIVVSLGLVGSLFADPASAFFFGGFGKKGGCGNGYGMGYGMDYGWGGCAPAYCAPAYCGPTYCPPPACGPMYGKKGKKAKAKKMK